MVFITVESFFWIKTKDIEDGLGTKNIHDSIRKQMQGIFET